MADTENVREEAFNYAGHEVEIRKSAGRVELVIDDEVHELRFLDNGRPFTSTYVNAMVTSVRGYVERFIDFTAAQESYWKGLRAGAAGRDEPAP